MEGAAMKRMKRKNAKPLIGGVLVLVAMTLCFPVVPGFKTEARAGDAGAFVGGMVAGHVIHGFVERDRVRTAAAVDQASSQRQMAQQAPAPARSAQTTTEQKLQELDKLAAGGYITPEEYKTKKKAILDGM
jgi:hypothetical protein